MKKMLIWAICTAALVLCPSCRMDTEQQATENEFAVSQDTVPTTNDTVETTDTPNIVSLL